MDTPELFDRVKGDNFLEEIIPVVTLITVSASLK
jgi:hypothetical protein